MAFRSKGMGGGLRLLAAITILAGVEFSALAFMPAPESEINVSGSPFTGTTAHHEVRGFIDTHTHLFGDENMGGRVICGKVYDPGGASKALVDCGDHLPYGIPAWFENFMKNGSPIGTHETTGWPTFRDWPAWNSLTHQMMYIKWVERAWRSGLRIMVNDLVANRALCEIYPLKKNPCDEMATIRLELARTLELQGFIDAQNGGPGKGWFRIVYTPDQARKVIAEGKLAVVLGIETSEPFGCRLLFGKPQCDEADIDAGLDEAYALGVRSMFLCHKFDNALCGVRFDSGTPGVIVNVGNFYSTGEFWQVEQCTEPYTDNTIEPGRFDLQTGPLAALQPAGVSLPVYPRGPHCNRLGLTGLGMHMLEGMMQRGMIVEIDHMGVKAASETLSALERNGYPGIISSHSWADRDYFRRIYGLGGFVGTYAGPSEIFVADWLMAREDSDPKFKFGFGFGIDANGLGYQGWPRPGNADNPVEYPFKSFDGGSMIYPQRTGQRIWNVNASGRPHYGLIPDWLEDARLVAGPEGPQFVKDLLSGAEAYLQMWERVEAWTSVQSH